MKRRALLIEAAKATGKNVILGCERDVERLNSWLLSLPGGAWNEEEIITLHNPNRMQIESSRGILDQADFSFVSFSGHGRIIEDFTGKRTQMLTIGTGVEINFDILKPKSPKAIISCDACREVERVGEPPLEIESFTKCAKAKSMHSRKEYRDKFELAVRLASVGNFTMFSCSSNECAGDDALNGGVFTDALLNRAGEMFSSATRTTVFDIETVFAATRDSVAKAHPDQNPEGRPSNRTGNPFPFCIYIE
jgi:hypothetical protein